MDRSRLSWVCGRERGKEGGEREQVQHQEAKGTKGEENQNSLILGKAPREGQPSPQAGESRVGGGYASQEGPETGRDQGISGEPGG